MTARELIAKYRACGPQELPVFLHFLADHWYYLRLADGQRLNDNSDSSLALRELAEAARIPEGPKVMMGEFVVRDHTCLDCGHEHEGRTECTHYLGEGKFCKCTSKVTA